MQHMRSAVRFYIAVLRYCWWEQFWSCAATLFYYSTLMIRIPLFGGLMGGHSTCSFNQALLLLSASCISECLICSMQSYFLIRTQVKAQLLLQTAVFKKVTCLSAAAIADYPCGNVCSLLAADAWIISMSTTYLAGAFMGMVCVTITLGMLAQEMGYAPACACLAWWALVAMAAFSVRPLLDRCYATFYNHRDARFRKLSDFLSSVRLIKMSALENVFQSKLLQLRSKEVNKAFYINVLESLIDTIFSISSSVMVLLVFVAVTLRHDDRAIDAATMFSCVYLLTLTDTFTGTTPHVVRLKSPAFRSCRRLMSYLAEEEHTANSAESQDCTHASNGEVIMKNCSFAWAKRSCDVQAPTLQGINLHIRSGSLVGVVGAVGSGKTSLLSAIAGDMSCLGGIRATKGSIAIVPQTPQVLNISIRDNITFGRKYDYMLYRKVLRACQLLPDLQRLPAGDLTKAGDKGEMLSGGQKQRVCIARALYSRSDINLLDDLTSSQDPQVKQKILEEIFGQDGLLSGKTCVFVTQIARLPFSVHQWLLMNNRSAVLISDVENVTGQNAVPLDYLEDTTRPALQWKKEDSRSCQPTTTRNAGIFAKEEASSHRGFLDVCVAYFKYSGICAVFALICFAASGVLVACQLFCIKEWVTLNISKNVDNRISSRIILHRLAAFCLGDVLCKLAAGMLFARATWQRSTRLHIDMLERVVRSPLSFFDATPRGRTLNRFTVDLETNDIRTFVAYKQLFQNLFCILGRQGVIGFQAPVVFGLACVTEIFLLFAMYYCLHAAVVGRFYESTRLSRVLQHLTETLESLGSIRVFGVVENFCAVFRRLMNEYLRGFHLFILCYAFTRLVVTLCAQMVVIATAVIVVVPAQGDATSAATVGLSLLSSLTVPFAMTGVFLVIFWMTQGDVAFKRALEYTELPEEQALASEDTCFSGNKYFGCPGVFIKLNFEHWPCHGAVRFHHYSASYRPGIIEDAIKGISFSVQPREKVAIVGRTGAGKSSIILALLRMIPCTSGSITIDGIDISRVPLKTLRSAISVIHQDPSLWSGTLRENLDPEGCSSDGEIWRVLGSVYLSTFVENSVGGLSLLIGEKGGNLSAGQRQLVSLARALLRGTRILVLDEATSQMDPETDRRVQATLRESFAHCAVITVAHRIDTILDYDRVVVMSEGRVLEYGSVPHLLADQSSTFRGMVKSSGIDPDLKLQASEMK
ncbi:ATP-binding cassette sub-family C member 2-like [Dermacentor silvarum]|uniref:ATP-binding cassette sub-family C member 2-like n=1 Tax=Dermacentor silvarum TaxID=543639 RepID=UPI0021019305|nr:ATP-binding cassette sub-family C member 2-like [Dermacentor silvarum]